MLDVFYGAQFEKDMKQLKKRGADFNRINSVINTLRIPEKLPEEKRDHLLTGDYKGYRECHIRPDWLLIYRYLENSLYLYRTGTHSDLFR